MAEENALVRIARIGRLHGIRGEVTVEIFTDSPNSRFAEGKVVLLRSKSGKQAPREWLTIQKARWNKKILLLKFEEISDRNAAEALRDTELYVGADTSDDHSWYADELVFLTVTEIISRSPIVGDVTDLITGAAQDLLVVRLLDESQMLIPFVEEIVPEINEEVGAVVITPPPGLLELNQD